MKTISLLLLSTLFAYLAFGQLPGQQATKKEHELMRRSRDCAKVGLIPVTERLKRYPFNNARQIQLVSFKSIYDSVWGQYSKDGLPLENDTVVYSKLFEVKTLTQTQIDTLTDLMYNYGYKFKYKPRRNVYFVGSVKSCYNPRNAILFLDRDHKVFEFIEVCFECEGTRESSKRVSLGISCNQKLLLIKDFFKTLGIEYGITTGLMTDE